MMPKFYLSYTICLGVVQCLVPWVIHQELSMEDQTAKGMCRNVKNFMLSLNMMWACLGLCVLIQSTADCLVSPIGIMIIVYIIGIIMFIASEVGALFMIAESIRHNQVEENEGNPFRRLEADGEGEQAVVITIGE